MKNMVNEMNVLINSVVVDVFFGFFLLVGFIFMLEMVYQFKMIFFKVWVLMYEVQFFVFLLVICDGCFDFVIGMLSDEMKLQDLYVELLFEFEFVLVVNWVWIGNGMVCLVLFQYEQWVLLEINMGYYSELLIILQCSGICCENIVNIDLVVMIYNLVFNVDFLMVIFCDMIMLFGLSQFVIIFIKEVLLVVCYVVVWLKNYWLKIVVVLLVEMVKYYFLGQGNCYWQLL